MCELNCGQAVRTAQTVAQVRRSKYGKHGGFSLALNERGFIWTTTGIFQSFTGYIDFTIWACLLGFPRHALFKICWAVTRWTQWI